MHDFRQRLDHMLDPFARPDQPEGQKHLSPFDTKLRFAEPGFDKVEIGNAVGNDIYFLLRHTVNFVEDLQSLMGHDDKAVATGNQDLHHPSLIIIWLTQECMQRGHHRHSHLLEQGKKMAPCRSSIDTEFVLHAEHIGIVEVQKISGLPVGSQIFFQQLEAHMRRVIITLGTIIDRPDETVCIGRLGSHCLAKIMGKCRNPTQPGRVVPQKGDAPGLV